MFIKHFNDVPPKLNDKLQADSMLNSLKMESLAVTHLLFLESLVTNVIRNGKSMDDFTDYFTRVVYAKPSIFFIQNGTYLRSIPRNMAYV